MTTTQESESPSPYGSPKDWASIISGAAKGGSSAIGSNAALANSKKEAIEAKRRTIANLLNNAMKRNQALFRVGQDYEDEMYDTKANSLQQMAKGFVDALQGSTGRF